MGFTKTEALLTQILIQSEKQTELLEKIYQLLMPPIILDGGIPEENKKRLLEALENLNNMEEDL